MQYGYGMAETHQQQFMEGDSCSSLFSISTSQKQNQHHHPHYHPYHHSHLPPPEHPSPQQEQKHERQQQFFQLHPVPFTQQLLQQQHQFEAFQLQQQGRLHQQLRLENELGGGNGGGGRGEGAGNGCGGGNGGNGPSPHFFDFKLGLNENSGNREVVMNEEDGEEEQIHGSRQNSLEMPQCCWHSQEDGTIKEPFWKPLNAQLFHKNDKESIVEDKQKTDKVKINVGQVVEKNLGHKYTFFGELEAICGGAGLGETNQTGSESALTGENLPSNVGTMLRPLADPNCRNSGAAEAAMAAAASTAIGVDHGSETSIGEEASLQKKLRKRKRRRKMKEELNSMAGFFESLVKQLMDHQEGLYRKFLDVVERIDQERVHREEEWRTQQFQSLAREAAARAHEQALASSREAAIVSYFEKITGQTIDLPKEPIKINSHGDGNTNSRWPKAEVEALIQVRSSLEGRFQEPGLKGPLWEEISTSMASMGYQRSAKRCKEKWENINKYFRKTKHINKKRSHPSKTCPYFHQLDQLYSRTPLYQNPSSAPAAAAAGVGNNSELLDAIIAINDPQKVASMDDKAEADEEMNHGNEKENEDEEEEEEEEEEEDDEEKGGGGDAEEEDGD